MYLKQRLCQWFSYTSILLVFTEFRIGLCSASKCSFLYVLLQRIVKNRYTNLSFFRIYNCALIKTSRWATCTISVTYMESWDNGRLYWTFQTMFSGESLKTDFFQPILIGACAWLWNERRCTYCFVMKWILLLVGFFRRWKSHHDKTVFQYSYCEAGMQMNYVRTHYSVASEDWLKIERGNNFSAHSCCLNFLLLPVFNISLRTVRYHRSFAMSITRWRSVLERWKSRSRSSEVGCAECGWEA